MIFLLASFFGALIGFSLGLLGGGGSILTVPVLVYVFGQEARVAVATSLAIVGSNAFLGTLLHWRAGHVRVRQALAFGVAGMVGAYGAAGFSRYVSDALLMVLFACLMLFVGTLMVRPLAPPVPGAGARPPFLLRLARTLVAGVSVGVLTGFLGVGGGFLIVPALVLVLGLPMVDAVGSSLLVIGLNSAAGLAGHLQAGGLDWRLVALFVLSGAWGLRLGTHLCRRWPAERLRRAFAAFVVALALLLLGANVPLLF